MSLWTHLGAAVSLFFSAISMPISRRRLVISAVISRVSSSFKGCNILIRCDGITENLGGMVERVIQAGERVIIKTPGGGGFGRR